MNQIETLADNFLKAYYANTREEYQTYAKELIRQLEKDEWQFRKIENNYNVAKALYYLNVQDDNEEISTDTNCTIYKLMYYCLLKNYISSTQKGNINSLIKGSKLALIILCEQAEYFMYGILDLNEGRCICHSERPPESHVACWPLSALMGLSVLFGCHLRT